MDDLKKQVIDRLKQANNILVTVRNDPSVDLLSACIGLSLLLDKQGKHAAAVFSGEVPSVMDFLKPEETIEQTPNSLRDFIIALDKSKADKLRYKVEDKVVRIFITPYKTSITQDDLEFTQGDFNIDVVVALGAHEQQDLDSAITAHGRILHDAAVISINNTPNGNLGSLNWQDARASSVSEMIADLASELGKDNLDEQIATALLTGIVAETDRFSNDKTTPQTMNLAGDLMAAGANQQLVANELKDDLPNVSIQTAAAGGARVQDSSATTPDKSADDAGALDIAHEAAPPPTITATSPPPELPSAPAEKVQFNREMLPVPDPTHLGTTGGNDIADGPFTSEFSDSATAGSGRSYLIDQPANQSSSNLPPVPSIFDKPTPADPSSLQPTVQVSTPAPAAVPVPAAPLPSTDTKPTEPTLADLEALVRAQPSETPAQTIDDARSQVENAYKQIPPPLKPIDALNAQPMIDELHPPATPGPVMTTASTEPVQPPAIVINDEGVLIPADQPKPWPATETAANMPLPPVAPDFSAASDGASKPVAPPPPVPPPFVPPVS